LTVASSFFFEDELVFFDAIGHPSRRR
jgi:hypothetical protein